ncbi:MAG: cell wall metabolism sensor histidine kinase WalK [Lachnospiraceae bacterium]|nr:cell wall metabolism sensor histidine kinase WalK [Lachnospiraceae bacterium]
MIKRIFKNTFWVSMVTLFVSYLIIVGILYDYFEHQIKAELKTEAEYIAYGIDYAREEYLINFNRYMLMKQRTSGAGEHKKRITWIDKTGDVLFDSDVDAKSMENHKNRKEIKKALENGEGYTVRYSGTLDEQTLYYAVELTDGTVLRISSAYNTILAIVLAMLQPTAFLIFLIIILSYFMSKRAAKSIVEPINNMDLLYGEMDEEYEELVPLLRRIRKQNILIDRQIEDLKNQQAKFQALTEHMNEGFLVLDKKGNVLSYNPAVVELFEGSKDIDYTGKHAADFDRSGVLKEALEEALKGARNQKIRKTRGKVFHIFSNPILLEDTKEDGITEEILASMGNKQEKQVAGAVIIVLDETEKEKREQLRREFTSNVSHELKTPLTSISGVAEIIMNGIVKTEDIPGFARNIYEEAGRLIELINDIIFLSKLDEGHLSCHTQKINLKDLAKQVIERLSLSGRTGNVSVQITGEDVVMEGIPSMIEEVLYNLCDNGIKYNHAGGTVILAFYKKEIDDTHKIIISVKDTGIGIPAEETDRIFERFYRVDKSHSRSAGGTGLGLSIVKHVVLMHHGEIQVESEPGKGTQVTVILPEQAL